MADEIDNRRANVADRAVFDRVLAGKGSETDKARVRDIMAKREKGQASPEELSAIVDQLEIDPVMGLLSASSFSTRALTAMRSGLWTSPRWAP
ncbi:MAG: hypothetical protein MZV49_24335 [Rhodopseudomonas palustris]|nr:hypothetical protein [Rhodopseudomonas palustris]